MSATHFFLWFIVTFPAMAFADIALPPEVSVTASSNGVSNHPSNDEAKLLSEVTATYRSAALVEMAVEKRITYEWKLKQDVSAGKMYYSKGKVRWEMDKPEKNWTIYDGKSWWNIEFASSDFPGGKNKVTQTNVDKKNKEQFFVLDLLASKDPSQQFAITKKSGEENQIVLLLNPKKKASVSDVQVTLSKDKKSISEISFKDDIGNMITIKLGTPEIRENVDAKLFKYTPDLKKDQVSHL